jgi:hypothetical protein
MAFYTAGIFSMCLFLFIAHLVGGRIAELLIVGDIPRPFGLNGVPGAEVGVTTLL